MTGSASLSPTAVDLPSLLPSSLLTSADTLGAAPRRRRTVRDWGVDLFCFLICLALGLLLVAAEQHSVDAMPTPLVIADVASGLACCVLLWWRRRWPVALSVGMAVVGAYSTTSALAGTAMIFTVAVHRRATVAVAVALAGIAAMPVYFEIHPHPQDSVVVDAVVGVLITALALAWGMFTRARRQLVLSLRERALRAETEQQLRVDQARRTERARIAREMHDVLAHRISLVSVHAGALEFRSDATREQVAEAAGVIRANAHQALQELREVIGVLREDPPPGAEAGDRPAAPERPQPGFAEIPALVGESTGAGARVRYLAEVREAAEVPSSVGRTAYRVVQEGLTNARKHAPGLPIEVRVTGGPRAGLTVEVTNPSPAWPPSRPVPGAGLGLIGLTERVQLSGGRLDHGVRDARFVLRARLPWRR